MWELICVSPFAMAGWWIGAFVAQATPGPALTDTVLAPLGAALPFAALALWVIRRQEHVIDALTAELRRVNDETINKFVLAINDATTLHRESTRMWEQVLDELRRAPARPPG